MPLFNVTMTHPDGEGWGIHVRAHVEYLLQLIENDQLKASGPLKGLPKRNGFLIIKAENREEVERIVADDPFAKEDLILDLSIHEWDPLFGILRHESSKAIPPGFEDLAPRIDKGT